MKLVFGFLVTLSYCSVVLTAPPSTTESLVVSSTKEANPNKEITKDDTPPKIPKISSMNVETNVANRFATTQITSKVKNLDVKSQEATFSVVLPESAYISGFIMEIDGTKYEAHVKEKEEAKKAYDEAVSSGIAAGHVAVNARDSNRFTVSVNIEPESKAVFYLTYEELLKRQNGQYEIVINLHPGQLIKDLGVQVNINESRPLTSVKAPSMRSGNEISKNDEKLDPKAEVELIGDKTAKVTFKPDIERQKELAKNFETKENDGLAGQFVVQYDVKRDPQGGEILVSDGYFVHFFAPSDLKPLPKYVVFVLDTSGSMWGTRIEQLKQAMKSILGQLNKEDSFNIIDFSSDVRVWNIPKVEVQYKEGEDYVWQHGERVLRAKEKNQTLPGPFEVSEENIKQAKNVVDKLGPNGGTNIDSALNVGLKLVKENKEKNDNRQPIVMFLTDGEPTEGEMNPDTIMSKVSKENSEEIPIFSLSFGEGADRSFLEKISLKNHAFARHIYEGADASLQLESFYKYISSPLLNKVDFKYTQEKVSKVTKTEFPILFDGSEIVVAGKYPVAESVKSAPETSTIPDIVIDPGFAPVIRCFAGPVPKEFVPKFENPIGSLEKHWAYITLQQILDERDVADNKTDLTKKALDLALKYSFVTPVTSLVVVKPNNTKSETNLEDASKGSAGGFGNYYGAVGAGYGGAPGLAYRPLSFSSAALPAPLPPGIPPYGATFHDAISTPLMPSYTTESVVIEKSHDLKTKFAWLDKIYNEANKTVNIDQGSFILETAATILDVPQCSNTPTKVNGTCVLLSECPQVHSFLTDVSKFKEIFCPINEWAGVCCPVKPDDLPKIQNFKKVAAAATPNI